jgi:hypothetical protein
MAKTFDATMKTLIRNHAADWLTFVGVPIVEPPEVLDTDLSAVSASADTLIRVGDRVIHIDIQAGPDENLARRMLLYNVLAHYHTRLPVQSTVVILRSKATRSNMQDRVTYGDLQFGFDLIKVWERPAEEFLTGGIGLLPMAVIARPPPGRTREQSLPMWVDRIAERVEAEAPQVAADIVLSSFIMAGMHVSRDVIQKIYRGVFAMRESVAYDIIMEEGAIAHTRNLILRMGRLQFGTPSPEQEAQLRAIDNLPRLDRMLLRSSKMKSWDALLRGR